MSSIQIFTALESWVSSRDFMPEFKIKVHPPPTKYLSGFKMVSQGNLEQGIRWPGVISIDQFGMGVTIAHKHPVQMDQNGGASLLNSDGLLVLGEWGSLV